jgi:hypothetical protein
MCTLKLVSIFYKKKWAKKITVYKQEEATQSDRSALATVKTDSIKAAEISWFSVLCFL